MLEVNVKLWRKDATPPVFTRSADACADIQVCDEEDAIVIWPGETKLVYTGFSLEIPPGYEGLIRGRSGLATKGLIVHPGCIDHEYRGRVGLILHCVGKHYHTIKRGDRVAQLAIRPVPAVSFAVVDELGGSERSQSGFGSSGV